MKKLNTIIAIAGIIILTACGSSKNTVSTPATDIKPVENTTTSSYVYVGKVSDNAVTFKSLVSSIDFSLNDGNHEITLDGKLRMKRDEVIRINITAFGLMEVGVLEFTPDYVLIIDRVHSQYVKESYEKVDFLSQNGLSFYSLQALFWNELFYPGVQTVSEQTLRQFNTKDNGSNQVDVALTNDNMNFLWKTSRSMARIDAADVSYNSTKYGTTKLHWDYSDFKALAGKQFPHRQSFNLFNSIIGKGKNASVTIVMGKTDTNKDFDSHTTPSQKYKQVDAQTLLKKLLSF